VVSCLAERNRRDERDRGSLVSKYESFYLCLGTRLFILDWDNHGVGSRKYKSFGL